VSRSTWYSLARWYRVNDTDGDGDCGYGDNIYAPLDTLYVWLDTNHNYDGAAATCQTGEELTLSGYELVIHGTTTSGGSIAYGTWTNLIPEFTVDQGSSQADNTFRVSYASPGPTYLPPGRYRLGGLPIQTSGGICSHTVYVVDHWQIGSYTYDTGFYSQCPGKTADYKVRLGLDFIGACAGGVVCSDVKGTTWGKIKRQYQ